MRWIPNYWGLPMGMPSIHPLRRALQGLAPPIEILMPPDAEVHKPKPLAPMLSDDATLHFAGSTYVPMPQGSARRKSPKLGVLSD